MNKHEIRILLVEDDVGDAQLIRTMLRGTPDVSYELWHAQSLREGLAALGDAAYDVVLLDLTLPDSCGLATFVRMRVASPALPIIVLTGMDDDELARAAVRRGAQDFLGKRNMDEQKLDRAIRYALERHRLYRRTEQVNATLLEAERNRVVQETAGGVAHEINQPLTVITVVADHLLHELSPTDPNYDLIVSLSQASRRVDEIVQAMKLVKRYAVKPYTDVLNILDIEDAASRQD
jgi:DNA-binding NtrC family response regulator